MNYFSRFFFVVCMVSGFIGKAKAAPHFLSLPTNDAEVYLQQGWLYDYSSSNHCGVDYRKGTSGKWYTFEVTAAHDGDYTCSWSQTWGWYAKGTYEADSHTYYSIYAHLASCEFTSGSFSAGDYLGMAGKTGSANDILHLHFELGQDNYGQAGCGENVDPYDLYDTQEVYPDIYNEDGTCGTENLWTQCPPVMADTCTLVTRDTYTAPKPMGLVTISENGSAYDFHQYYVSNREYHLLNNGDMNTAARTYANPVILAQGSVAYHYQWLNGDVNGDSYDDIVEIQHLSNSQFSEVVWLSNGDGSFQSQVVWQTVNTGDLSAGQNHYFLGDVDNDGKDDVVIGRDEGSASDVVWWQCLSSGSSFNACSYWNGSSDAVTAGKVWANNIFLLGDVTGDGKADLVRGYNTSGQTDPCSTTSTYDLADGYSLRWKVLPGGSSTLSDFWGTNSGCLESTYLLGDEDGDGKQDLVEVRFEDAKTGHVYVRKSTGIGFNDAVSWKNDFGSPNMNYFTYDVMGDNSRDALLSHSSGSGLKVKVMRASADGYFKRGYTYSDEIEITGSGTWLPGHYGDLALKTGTEQVCESSGASTSSPYDDGILWDVDGTVYEFWTSDEAWHGYGSSDAFDSCGNDWDSIETVSSSVFSWELTGSVISNSFECGVTHQNDVYAWNGTVYKISGSGTKQGFTSPDVFLGCGYAWGDLDFLSLEESTILTTLSDGSAISYVGDCGYAEDLIVREVSTGALVQWTMDGSTVSSWSSLGSSSLEWEVVGAGDFNRDGSLDLLWRRLSSPYDLYAWLMDGSTVSSSVLVSSSTDSGWVIRGVFDFTYDGEPDILWKNQSSGALSLWEMNGTTYVSSITVASATSTDWDIRAIGDLTGEGDPDILWRDSVTGALSLWDMDGTSYVSSITIASSSSLDWDVEAIGDYTSDGENDLLWRNPDTGDMAVWEMSGTSYVSSVSMAWSSPAWDLVAAGKMAE